MNKNLQLHGWVEKHWRRLFPLKYHRYRVGFSYKCNLVGRHGSSFTSTVGVLKQNTIENHRLLKRKSINYELIKQLGWLSSGKIMMEPIAYLGRW